LREWRLRGTYLIFGDIEGKLDVLNVQCTKCGRKGRYHVRKLIEKYGRKADLYDIRMAPKAKGLDETMSGWMAKH
jgi:hypothetical protein